MNEQHNNQPYQWSDGSGSSGSTPEGDYRWNYSTLRDGAKFPDHKPKNKGLTVFLVIVAVLVVLTVCVFSGARYLAPMLPARPESDGRPPLPEGSSQQDNTLPPASSLPEIDYGADADANVLTALTPTEIYKQCSPCVVGVLSYLDEARENLAMGSGVIMSSDGYLITNAHVVAGCVAYDVVTPDGEYHEAKLMGFDSQTDIAVLRITDGGPHPYATFGDSTRVEVGELVAAIGNPDGLNLANTQTVGYVSALNRLITTETTYSMECIQTDAAINPGSSGGPLINRFGQVIGITSAKFADVDFEGIGFAIPINTALPIAKELILRGRVTGRAMLGIQVQEVITPAMADYYKLPAGLVIAAFTDGCDIANSRAQVGDIVVSIDGAAVSTLGECSTVLARYKPGDTVSVELFHIQNSFNNTGESYTIDIVLAGS